MMHATTHSPRPTTTEQDNTMDFSLTLNGTIDPTGADPDGPPMTEAELRENLESAVLKMMGEGLITRATSGALERYEPEVKIASNTDTKNINFTMTLTGTIDPTGAASGGSPMTRAELRLNLERAILVVMGDGLITRATSGTLERYEPQVMIANPSQRTAEITSIDQIRDGDEATSFALDGLVHDAASEMASNANNGGAREQVEFLRTLAGWDDDAIIKAFNDASEEG
ncbi:hypothetical protein [Halomonas sp. I5-271120]|uniref:hypothetical protein n=1 Tax=Halomonas sp. I5-271120 TaxID=3061632 RepID=UPI002714AB35|nr:hypothetical protein [Halomonas sp. I5-271120]